MRVDRVRFAFSLQRRGKEMDSEYIFRWNYTNSMRRSKVVNQLTDVPMRKGKNVTKQMQNQRKEVHVPDPTPMLTRISKAFRKEWQNTAKQYRTLASTTEFRAGWNTQIRTLELRAGV
ncbi:hypothetical protein OPV22_035196 [Ensete ventricosum]|uniref:Uncharacterized protein n=1 Tax=Ensete ventricosum TaxID=4639 RepID=A0AAX5K620_ENSVE|nr:hypothetical protein OPV22_035221 [Ensete ventricosum]KAJ8454542.1 hypothetical protein OPV22_035213 [Ensete ventricosum]KAJ8454555.1 hypothetical protein OPV22_035212 [Ensete ventricosum]KAJ8454793.1 hypothetical protein OPV22_035204 [Ensete ventricosum]KAJ8455053.1 hypothetical protein OPV22_035196 [Ensete ventricosum]